MNQATSRGYTLFRISITPLSQDGQPLGNQYMASSVARDAVGTTGIIAAAWTQGTVEVLISAHDENSAHVLAEHAGTRARYGVRTRTIDAHHGASFLGGLAAQCAALIGSIDHSAGATTAYGEPRGLLLNPAIRFAELGLTADGVLAAMETVL